MRRGVGIGMCGRAFCSYSIFLKYSTVFGFVIWIGADVVCCLRFLRVCFLNSRLVAVFFERLICFLGFGLFSFGL